MERPRINSQLEKTGEEELAIRPEKQNANNFKKANASNTLMNENTTTVSTGGTKESGVRMSRDDKDSDDYDEGDYGDGDGDYQNTIYAF